MSKNGSKISNSGKSGSVSLNKNTSATVHIGQVLQKVLRRVERRVIPRTKLPSGWMDLNDVLQDFKIGDEMFKKLIFRENLVISCFNNENRLSPVPIGGLSLDIQAARGNPFNPQEKLTRAEYKNPERFLVHLSSQLDWSGNNGGSRITSWVNRDLQTLEEKRREYIRHVDKIKEKHIYLCTMPDHYYVRRNKTEDLYYSPKHVPNLIGEGANFILMRYLAITRFIGSFEVTTAYVNGDLCRNIYDCKGPSSGFVNDTKLDVCKIYRTIIERCGIVHKCATLLTLQGQILRQEWKGCRCILQVNPLTEIKNEKPVGNVRIPLEKTFINDLELLSRYLDAKTKSKKMIETYMHDHSEVKQMIGDYVQTILQLKPEDITDFTAKYFLSFTPELLPYTEYFEPTDYAEADDDEFWRYF